MLQENNDIENVYLSPLFDDLGQARDIAHIACAAEVIRLSFRTVAEEFGLTPENCPSHPAFIGEEQLQAQVTDGLCLFGCFMHERLVGVVGVKSIGEREFSLERLAVLPAYRHHGIGTQLMALACAHIRRAGGQMITIGIIEENTVLKRWYEAQGFTVTDSKRFPHLPFTVCLMAKQLIGKGCTDV